MVERKPTKSEMGELGDVAGLSGLREIGYLPSLTPRSTLIGCRDR